MSKKIILLLTTILSYGAFADVTLGKRESGGFRSLQSLYIVKCPNQVVLLRYLYAGDSEGLRYWQKTSKMCNYSHLPSGVIKINKKDLSIYSNLSYDPVTQEAINSINITFTPHGPKLHVSADEMFTISFGTPGYVTPGDVAQFYAVNECLKDFSYGEGEGSRAVKIDYDSRYSGVFQLSCGSNF